MYACGLRRSEEPHIGDNFSKIGHHVRASASGDKSGIEGERRGPEKSVSF